MESTHYPVLLQPAVTALAIHSDGIYADLTFGRGGHSTYILNQLGPGGKLIVMDRDPQAIHHAQEKFADDSRVLCQQGPFSTFKNLVKELNLVGKVNGVLLDLGVSSPQLDDPERGFSFLRDGPLDMRMDPDSGQSAAAWLEKADMEGIAQVLKEYGEERHAKRIARAIVEARKNSKINTTKQLADIVMRANKSWEKGKHPATRTFQAIRIYINQELDELRECLMQAIDILAVRGRIVVISFHSLEDRIVKRFFRQRARGDFIQSKLPLIHEKYSPVLRIIGKPIFPDNEEKVKNPRSRSAVLRVAERLAA